MIGKFITIKAMVGFYNIVDVILHQNCTMYLVVDEKGHTSCRSPYDLERIVDKEEVDEYIKANTVGYLVGIMNQKNFTEKTELLDLEKALEYIPNPEERLSTGTAWVIMRINGKDERKVTHYYTFTQGAGWREYKE